MTNFIHLLWQEKILNNHPVSQPSVSCLADGGSTWARLALLLIICGSFNSSGCLTFSSSKKKR